MNRENDVNLLADIVRLINEMLTTDVDFIGKDEIVQHLRWAAKHIAESVWLQSK